MTTWDNIEKTGTFVGGWAYNENNLEYDQAIDPDSGNPVAYNGIGGDTTWTNITKSS